MSIIFLIVFFIISALYSRKIYFPLFITSIISVSVDTGYIPVVFLFFVILFGFFCQIFSFNKKGALLFILSFCTMLALILFSLKNGGYIYNAIGKSLRVFIIFFLFFISYKKGFLSFYEVRKIIRAFYITTFIAIPVLYYMGYYNNQGIIIARISGFLYDPNYLSLFCFIFVIYLSYFGRILQENYIKDIMCLLLIILLCQSWSMFAFVFIYFLIGHKKLCYIGKKINPYFSIYIIFFLWVLLYGLDKIVVFDDWGSSQISLKFNSIIFRLNAMVDGFLIMQDNISILFYGMGSGRTLEITDRVFHNLYFQQLFDHGVFYYFIYVLLLWYLFKCRFNSKKTEIIQTVVLFLYINNIFFDNFYSFIFPLSIFLFLSTKIRKIDD